MSRRNRAMTVSTSTGRSGPRKRGRETCPVSDPAEPVADVNWSLRMLPEHRTDALRAHVGLPDAHDGVAACGQIRILRGVSRLLPLLPGRQRGEARMSMPVVAVRLDDQT